MCTRLEVFRRQYQCSRGFSCSVPEKICTCAAGAYGTAATKTIQGTTERQNRARVGAEDDMSVDRIWQLLERDQLRFR
jgi:hypothetical protein